LGGSVADIPTADQGKFQKAEFEVVGNQIAFTRNHHAAATTSATSAFASGDGSRLLQMLSGRKRSSVSMYWMFPNRVLQSKYVEWHFLVIWSIVMSVLAECQKVRMSSSWMLLCHDTVHQAGLESAQASLPGSRRDLDK
jgi:hypothetical protein